ncbi:MAG: aminopeptidase N [Pseudomonadota bacterium]
MPPTISLADYAPPAFLIDHVDLTIRLDGSETSAHGSFAVRRNPEATAASLAQSGGINRMKLDADGLGRVIVTIDGQTVEADEGETSVSFSVPDAETFKVTVQTRLNPDANKALSGLYRTGGVYCTQCEAEGFRRIIPFMDRPDVLSTYTVRLEALEQSCPVLLSNGNPVERAELGDGWVAQTWHDPHPKPSYLFAVVGGQLDRLTDTFTTMDDRHVDLAIYVEMGKGQQARFAMEALKRSMAWDEQRFGRAYDLDVFNIVAVSDFNLGAMENKGLNIFNDKYILASPETATDTDYQRIEAIIAHEYFHNWTGNRITCRDWFQLCLKEGLTVYRDQEYTSDTYDRVIKRIEDVRTLWSHQFPEDGGPLAHPVRPDHYREINNFYTATVYEKGAEIVRMMALWLGEEAFRRAMDRYFDSYDGQAVRIEEFIDCMRAESADPESWPDFLGWYQQAGTPKLRVESRLDSETRQLTLEFQQHTAPTPGQSAKKALPIPCEIGLVGPDGQDFLLDPSSLTVRGGRLRADGAATVFLLEADSGTVVFDGLPDSPVTPSILRGFSAPVALDVEGLSHAERLALAAHDSDGFNSWSHLQSLFSEALEQRYHRLGLGEPAEAEADLFDALATKIRASVETGQGFAVCAAHLTIPSAHDVARSIGRDVDPDRIVRSKHQFSADLCSAHGETLIAAVNRLGLADDPEIDAASAALRSFKLALLRHLAQSGASDALEIIAQSHAQSVGMTMRIGTLDLMLRAGHPMAPDALAAFEERFGQEPLAMDKWLSVQALAPENKALPVVEQLMRHPSFSEGNPNRVRALVGAFAMSNLAGFHAADGSGYRFLSAFVTRIDRDNPQLAARLASAFRAWRQFGPAHRLAAQDALEQVNARADLSRDLSDIVGRCLQPIAGEDA